MSVNNKAQNMAKRRKKLTRLSGLTEGLIAPALVKKNAYLRQIIAHWPEIAGDIAHWSRPSDIHPANETDKDGTLTLSIHSARGPEAMALASEILERVNRFVGFGLVHRLKVTQDLPLAPNQARTHTQQASDTEIKSQSLRDALAKLGKAIERNGRD